MYEGLFPKYYKNSSGTILKEYVFEGRRLSQLIDYENDRKYNFYYNVSGLRESMKVSQISTGYLVTATYFYYNSDNQLMFEDRLTYVDNEFDDNNIMSYMYDHNGELYGFKYNNTPYYYLRDALGNINAILSSSGSIVAKYEYDAWGNHKVLSSSGSVSSSTTFIGNINSFRYKGYYFDYETQLFYCNSRYYSPELCRFISPDSIEYLDPQSINGLNLYCYCMNDPVMYSDGSGHAPEWLGNLLIAGAGVLLIAGLAIATIATGGAAAGVAGAIFAGALKGALIGAAIGTVAGGAIGYAVDGVDGMWTGMAIGFTGGAVIGAVIGGTIGGVNYSPLKAASNAANKAIPSKGFNINKHLSTAGGKYSKFNLDSSDDILRMVQNGLKGQNVTFGPNTSAKSWQVIVDMGTQIGTKGQSAVKVIIGYGGKIWTMFPV